MDEKPIFEVETYVLQNNSIGPNKGTTVSKPEVKEQTIPFDDKYSITVTLALKVYQTEIKIRVPIT